MKIALLLIFLLIDGHFESAYAQVNIGGPAYELEVDSWINSEPISLNDVRGKVVLIRWWTAPSCPFCSASSTALNHWYETYKDQGFIVLGIYHHKESTSLSITQIKKYVEKFNFKFPVAVDRQWRTLKKWWLDSNKNWTSVSFLLDRNSTIRHIHDGGSYREGGRDYIALENKIKLLLEENQ